MMPRKLPGNALKKTVIVKQAKRENPKKGNIPTLYSRIDTILDAVTKTITLIVWRMIVDSRNGSSQERRCAKADYQLFHAAENRQTPCGSHEVDSQHPSSLHAVRDLMKLGCLGSSDPIDPAQASRDRNILA